jgi:hypothetical protein
VTVSHADEGQVLHRRALAVVPPGVTDLAVQEKRAPAPGATLVEDDDRRPEGCHRYADPVGHFFRQCTEHGG